MQRLSDESLRGIEAGISAIPFVGSYLATYFGKIRDDRFEERILGYCDYFGRRLAKLSKDKVDFDYLRSEEFAELFAQAADLAARSTTEHRRHRFANVLLNNALADATTRQRVQSILALLDRLSDLDAYVLLCYGHPRAPSFTAGSKDDVVFFAGRLSEFLGVDCPPKDQIAESVIYLDNLGLVWITDETRVAEIPPAPRAPPSGHIPILQEFSSFRTPLGDTVAEVIAPPDFFQATPPKSPNVGRPDGFVSAQYAGATTRP